MCHAIARLQAIERGRRHSNSRVGSAKGIISLGKSGGLFDFDRFPADRAVTRGPLGSKACREMSAAAASKQRCYFPR